VNHILAHLFDRWWRRAAGRAVSMFKRRKPTPANLWRCASVYRKRCQQRRRPVHRRLCLTDGDRPDSTCSIAFVELLGRYGTRRCQKSGSE